MTTAFKAKVNSLKGVVNYDDAEKAELLKRMIASDEGHQINRGSGMINAQRSDEYYKYLQNYEKALGPETGGYIPLDSNGDPILNSTYYEPLLGKNVHTDEQGRVRFQNKKIIELTEKAIDARENEIDKVTRSCIKSDILCCQHLQLRIGDLKRLLGAQKWDYNGKNIDVNCMPDEIRKYPPKSEKRLFAVHELRKLVDKRLMYVNLLEFGSQPEHDIKNPLVTDTSEDISKEISERVKTTIEGLGGEKGKV